MRRRLPVLLGAAATLAAAVAVVPTLSGASSPGASHPAVVPAIARPYRPLKGIAVDLSYASKISDRKAMSIGAQLFSMIVTHLHANAVSLNFPFWQAGSSSNDPKGTSITPTPARLEALTELAHRYHLTVQWRPYLYEGNLRSLSRPSIQPTDPNQWFANYWTFLQPYLAAASESGASGFSVAVELTSLMGHLAQWTTITEHAKQLYPGQLFYSQQHAPLVAIPLTDRGYDAYQPIHLSSPRLLTAARLTRGFIHNFELAGMQSTPGDLTIEELGIAAVSGAYNEPNLFHYPKGVKLDRTVQTDWFQGACNAFWSLHMQGLFYWSIDFNTYSPAENGSASPYNWLRTPTEGVVSRCFGRTR